MRNVSIAAFLLVTGSTVQAQTFSFPGGDGRPITIDIQAGCHDPSCVYVNVPGYVEVGRPRGMPRVHYGPPATVPDYVEYEVRPFSGAEPQRHRARKARAAMKAPSSRAAAVRKPGVTRQQPPQLAKAQPPSEAAKTAIAPISPKPRDGAVAPVPAPVVAAAPVRPPIVAAAPPAPPPAPAPGIADGPALSPAPAQEAPATSTTAAPVPVPQIEPAESAAPQAPKTAAADHPKIDPVAPFAQAASKPAPSPPRTVVAALPPAKKDIEERARPVPVMPIGVWASGEGQIRVERCGRNICGYAVGGASAGQMVLIHMRPAGDNRWSGQVKDVRNGQLYSGSISMRGTNGLYIEGCVLNGLFCGGRTLSRVR
jgi:hypothetical protein